MSKSSPFIGPFPSIGLPKVSTTLPRIPSPTFIDAIWFIS